MKGWTSLLPSPELELARQDRLETITIDRRKEISGSIPVEIQFPLTASTLWKI
jgi:hypothetical protein